MIPSERSHIFAAAATHPGMTGKSNEDRYAVSAFRLEDPENTPAVFAIVADGVGGHKAGEVAAEIAVNTITHIVSESDGIQPQETLEEAIVQASSAVLAQANRGEDQEGMGSTCACAWIIGDRLYTASVGDSRIYLLQSGEIRQASIDHTWVQEAIDHGIIQPEQARNHPRAHIIRRYLGSKTSVVPDFRLKLAPDETDVQALANQGLRVQPLDQLLLCSDGLTDLVDDYEIAEALQKEDLQAAIEFLIGLANQRGGHDNITILALRVPPSGSSETRIPLSTAGHAEPRQASIIPWVTCLGIALIVGLLIILGAVAAWYFTRPAVTPTPTLAPSSTARPSATLTLTPEEVPPTLEPTTGPTATLEPTTAPTLTPWPTSTPEN